MPTRWIAFVRGILRRRSIATEVEEELTFHLEQEAARQQALGAAPGEARRLAALQLGTLAVVRDEVADVRTTRLDVVWRELRVGVRGLLAAPSFTWPAVAVLALGIAGSTAIFSVIDGVMLRPLPFAAPEELVRVWSRNDERQIPFLSVSPADFEAWRSRTAAALQLAAYDRPRVVAPEDGLADPIAVVRVSPNLMSLLGVSPIAGRGFEPADARVPVALLSHRLWHSRFGGATDVVGRSVAVGSESVLIVGIMPRGFEIPGAAADLWMPLAANAEGPSRFAHTLRVLGRARGPADPVAVKHDLDVVAAQLASERPAQNEGWRVTVMSLFDSVVSPELRRSLWITAGAVLFLLLMATSSVAGLLLGRSAARQRELAVRVALGASRGSLVRLLLLESLVLAAVAGALGLAAAAAGLALLREAEGATIPRLDQVGVDPGVFVAAGALSIVAALAAGVLPAWRSTRSLHDCLRSRNAVSDPRVGRSLPFLVVVEMSCAVLLVTGAALLWQTVDNLHARPLGFDRDRLLSVGAIWPQRAEPATRVAAVDSALARLATTPGVTVAAAGSALPFSGQNSGNGFEIEGRTEPGRPLPDADYRVVSPTYFAAIGVPMQRGRVFDDTDRGRGVVIVSQTAAARFWAGRDPVGTRLKLGSSDWLIVVGVVGDARYGALDDPEDRVRPMLYVPHWQVPDLSLTFVVRTALDPASLADPVRRTLADSRGLRLGRLETLTAMVRRASASQRVTTSLVSAFAGCAVVLAAVGLYGLLALVVGRRTRELAVRFALGATPWHVTRLIVGRTLTLAAAGIALGMAASISLSGILGSVLFGVSANDPVTYAGVALGFGVLALAAISRPVQRALRVDPVRVMQAE